MNRRTKGSRLPSESHDGTRSRILGTLVVPLALTLLPSCQVQEVLRANAEARQALVGLKEELGLNCTLRWHSDSKMSPDVFEVWAMCGPPPGGGSTEELVPKIRGVLARSFHRKMSQCSITIEDALKPG